MAYESNLVTNPNFTSDVDPPTGWTEGTGATGTTEGSGQSGNCAMVACDGTLGRYIFQQISCTVPALYEFSCYFKKGSAAYGRIMVGAHHAISPSSYYTSGNITDAAWTRYSTTFTTTGLPGTGSVYVVLYSGEANNTAYFDTVVLRKTFTVGGELHMTTEMTLD